MNKLQELHEELELRLEAVERQRNRALTDHAVAEAGLNLAQQKLIEADKKINGLEQQVADLMAKLPTPPVQEA
jgi:polyhydroxyalkanoate synthesis regulator phasin